MNKSFEMFMRTTYGDQYDLTLDVDGFYCRAFEVWCFCRG